jgi:hypothetical protein
MKRFEAAEKARNIASLEVMIHDLEALAANLSQVIATEEERTKAKDPQRADYSMVAIAAAARRSKLIISLTELGSKLEAAKREHYDIAGQVREIELAQGVPPENVNMAHERHTKAAGHLRSLGFGRGCPGATSTPAVLDHPRRR